MQRPTDCVKQICHPRCSKTNPFTLYFIT